LESLEQTLKQSCRICGGGPEIVAIRHMTLGVPVANAALYLVDEVETQPTLAPLDLVADGLHCSGELVGDLESPAIPKYVSSLQQAYPYP
jgi:hypothetical protein